MNRGAAMECSQCQEHLVAYLEGLLAGGEKEQVALHLQRCPACRAEADAHERLRARLVADAAPVPNVPLDDAVMERIAREQTFKLRRLAMRGRYLRAGLGLAAAAAIAVVLLVPWGGSRSGSATAAEVMSQAVEALSDLHAVYIGLNVRTIARDNFEMIGLDYDFVPHEMWKEFGVRPRWRIEKPERVVVMDGESSLLLIRGRQAARGGVDTGFVGWLKPLLDVDKVLDSELRLAQVQGSEWRLTHEQGEDGAPKLVITIEARAQGDFSNDWLKNKSISGSDNRRVYRFDAETKLLEDLEVWVHGEDEDVLVLDVTEIVYDPEMGPDLFALDVPDDVIWFHRAEALADNEAYARMSPEEVARAFFQAFADEDWDEVLKFWPMSELDEGLKLGLGGLEIISIGEPFQSGRYPGWFVPYEIKLKWGETKKHNLAVRNDNPAGRYVVDGGV